MGIVSVSTDIGEWLKNVFTVKLVKNSFFGPHSAATPAPRPEAVLNSAQPGLIQMSEPKHSLPLPHVMLVWALAFLDPDVSPHLYEPSWIPWRPWKPSPKVKMIPEVYFDKYAKTLTTCCKDTCKKHLSKSTKQAHVASSSQMHFTFPSCNSTDECRLERSCESWVSTQIHQEDTSNAIHLSPWACPLGQR